MKLEGEVIDNLLSVASLELPNDARPAFTLLQETIFPVCYIHNLDFSHWVEKHEIDHRESFMQGVDLVLNEPLHNIRRAREYQHSDPD